MPDANPLDAARALAIGVASYADSRIPSLPQAILNDVNDFATVLRDPARGGFQTDSVRTLVDAEANRAGIIDGLTWLAEGSPSTRILYFSGHGASGVNPGNGSHLLPFDANLSSLSNTAIGAQVLSENLPSETAQRLLVVLDACHSAGFVQAKSSAHTSLRPGLKAADLEGLARGQGRVIIAACAEQEKSWVKVGDRNSVFTGAVLQGLEGAASRSNDGYVRVLDLYDFLSREVPKHASQHPILKVHDMNDNFAVARFRNVTALRTHHNPDDSWWDELQRVMIELYPQGPDSEALWRRAGGDESRLRRGGSGREAWYEAVRQMRLGGGVDVVSLLTVVRKEYPAHAGLSHLR